MSCSRNIYELAVKTFEVTCFLFPIDDEEVNENEQYFDSSNIHAAVEFNGAAEGMVIITPTASLLDAMAANMLGVDQPNDQEKQEALCEVANIISGNIVPMFSRDDEICYINPPRLTDNVEEEITHFKDDKKESVRVFLNEGAADIKVVYQSQKML